MGRFIVLKYNLYHIINIVLDLNELEYFDFIYMIFANHESFYICRIGNEPSEPSEPSTSRAKCGASRASLSFGSARFNEARSWLAHMARRNVVAYIL